MKKINGYWVDCNDNRWSKKFYTKEDAIKDSESLTDCTNCINCRNCIECVDCHNLTDCRNCFNCRNLTESRYCISCHGCIGCASCTNCIDCENCRDCTSCAYCIDCTGCIGCHYCHSYLGTPQRYTTSKIGSRKGSTKFYFGETKKNDETTMSLQVVCGCFKGDLKQFEDKVIETHGKESEYGKQYLKEINKVKVLFDLFEKWGRG